MNVYLYTYNPIEIHLCIRVVYTHIRYIDKHLTSSQLEMVKINLQLLAINTPQRDKHKKIQLDFQHTFLNKQQYKSGYPRKNFALKTDGYLFQFCTVWHKILYPFLYTQVGDL